MKEGRRMFQIFAARMFEQRVLTAYREKVALERQQKLIEELDDESRVDAQREAKRAKEAQRKKDKKRQQKQAKDEEKAKREAEKAAEEAAAKALEREKAEELRQRKEEQRKKKEAEKKAQDEEKQRREAEKQRRLQEAKEQQAEQERKQREQKEREKKKREELKRREREEREAREREVKEKKDREAAEKREREARAKNESEASEAKEQSKKGELAAKQFVQTALKRPSPANPLPVAGSVPAGLHPPLTTSSHASPRLQIATPVIPKAPTPGRQRQPSFRESRNNSPKVSQPAPLSSTTSPSVQHGAPNLPGKMVTQPNLTQQSQPSSRYSPVGAMSGQVTQPPGLPNTPSMGGNTFPTTFGPPLSPMAQQVPPNSAAFSNQAAAHNNQIRSFMPGMPFPPGINGSRQMPQGRAGNMDPPIPQVSAGSFPGVGPNDLNRYNMPRDNLPAHSHSRNTSASFERSAFETPGIPAQVQPIARPAPIKRPSSVAPHQQSQSIAPTNAAEIDDLSNHLGSSALVGDDDGPDTNMTESRRGSMAPRSARQGFGNNSGFSDSLPRGAPGANGGTWLAQHLSFGAPPMSGQPTWSNAPGEQARLKI